MKDKVEEEVEEEEDPMLQEENVDVILKQNELMTAPEVDNQI